MPKAGAGEPAPLPPSLLLPESWRPRKVDCWKRAAIGSRSDDSAETLRAADLGDASAVAELPGLDHVADVADEMVPSGGVHSSRVGEPTGGGGKSDEMKVETRPCRSTT